MIKIIKEGDTTAKVECPKCESLLEYDLCKDVQVSHSHRNEYHYIVCPKCGAHIFPSYLNGPKRKKKSFLERILNF